MKVALSKKQIALIIFGTAVFLRLFVIEGFVVKGDSMYPTILSGDYLFINKLAYVRSMPERGDVVVARSRSGERLVKRVMGLPEERFKIGEEKTNMDPGEYFLMGDNMEVSVDSRTLGAIDEWDISGKVFGIISFKRQKYIDF